MTLTQNMKPQLGFHGVTVTECNTDIAQYCVDFYQGDYNYIKIRDALHHNGFTIVTTEYDDGGELVIYFVNHA